MNNATIAWIVGAIIIVVLLGWFWAANMNTQNVPLATLPPTQESITTTPILETPTLETQTPSVSPEPVTMTLQVSTAAKLGPYLTASNGMTLYTYSKDTAGASNCSGTCAVTWPPYVVTAGATLTAASNAKGTLATITRDDGTTQVTYNGAPLYFYAKDVKAGDTTGQNVGGVWFVVKP